MVQRVVRWAREQVEDTQILLQVDAHLTVPLHSLFSAEAIETVVSGRAQIGQEGEDVHGDAGKGEVDVTGMDRWK